MPQKLFMLHRNCVYVTQELCLCHRNCVYVTHELCLCHRNCVYVTHELCLCHRNCVYVIQELCLCHRNCVYVTQELCLCHKEIVFLSHRNCLLRRNCVYACKDKITSDLVVPTNFIFGTEAVCTLHCHIQCCFSLPLILLTDQGFIDQYPNSEGHFCCNLMGSSMTRLLDILINSYGRMSVLNTVELHSSGLWLTGSAWPSVNMLRILKTTVPCYYRVLDQVQ
jgi:hypothetical protein